MRRPSTLHARRLGRLACAAACLLLALGADARDIVDMAGRHVTVPDPVHRIHAAQPYTHVLTYMVAPETLIGHLSVIREDERRLLRAETATLPLLGGSPLGGPAVNMETVLAARPDVVLLKGNAQGDLDRTAEKYAQIGLPVVFVDLDDMDGYPAAIEFLGRLTGRESTARQMADYTRRAFAAVDRAVASIPEDKRLRVYYAESADGLATECDQSFHADAIRRAGGRIVHQCLLKTHVGMERISLEQIIAYDPEVIVSNDPQFEATVYGDPRWQKVKAVADRRIWTVPRSPFNWIDRPPSATRILGVQWLAARFYPQAYPIDLRREVQEFHRLFMGIDPAAADLERWLK